MKSHSVAWLRWPSVARDLHHRFLTRLANESGDSFYLPRIREHRRGLDKYRSQTSILRARIDCMRVEPYGVGSIMHVTKRGVRGTDITRDISDQHRFAKLLFYMNDTFQNDNWKKNIEGRPAFFRPEWWPEREPLTRILAWTLLPNHVHLLVEETREGGTAKFLQRVFGSMTSHFNAKHKERGSLFQGAYRSRTVSEDTHLRYLTFYIQIKNVLELYPGGLKRAIERFDDAWDWAIRYKFSSLPVFLSIIKSPITEDESLRALYPDLRVFKDEARELLTSHVEHHATDEKLSSLILEPW